MVYSYVKLNSLSFSVSIGKHSSSLHPLACGVPQGSILAPVLFSIFMLPMGVIFEKYGVSFHLYADDTQLYFPLQHKSTELLGPLLNCLNELQIWLKQNLLVLNENKTEIILFGLKSYEDCALHFGHLYSYITPCAKNIGVLFDCNLGFEKQISAVVKSSFFHLRRLSKIKSLLSVKQFEQIIHLFVISHLDYCNSLYYGISQSSIMRLQMVQNAAARLMTGR